MNNMDDKGFINWSEYAENSKDLIGPFTPSPSLSPSNPEDYPIIEIELSPEDEERVQRAAAAYEKSGGFFPREAVEVLYRAYLNDIRKYQREHDETW